MANELKIEATITLTNGSLAYKKQPGAKYVTQTNAKVYAEVKSVSTSDAALTFGGLASSEHGWLYITNLDSTNYVDIGPDSGGAIVPLVRIKAGESVGPFRVKPSITIRSQANTGACSCEFVMIAT